MFCDLVGSTALSQQLDPEELREILRAYQEVCARVIHHFGGYIAQYWGDGLLVYFGHPVAHEDDAQRAVRAGLEILADLQHLNARTLPTLEVPVSRQSGSRPYPIQVRIGIHTGLVVMSAVGRGGRQQQLALGETPNIAARLQGLAAPDTVVISAATARLVHGYFLCRELGSCNIKGLSSSMLIYQVLGESGLRSRLQGARTMGMTPLVGREQEVELLLQRWEQSKEGEGQVVLLRGEAGIGKSRLVQVLKERIAREPHARLECHSSPYHQHSALYPIIDLLQRACGWNRDDSPASKLEKLEEAFSPYALTHEEVIPLLGALLSLPLPERYPALQLASEPQEQKTMAALLALLLAVAARQPRLVVVED
jgi:class 3 adenylate cyclase